MSGYPALEELIPHSEPMVLLDRMTQWEDGYAVCEVTLTSRSKFVEAGAVDAMVSIEYMAQTVAACLGYEAYQVGQGVRMGMIIASRHFTLDEQAMPVGSHLRVEAKRLRGNELLSHFDCIVEHHDGRRVASAQLTLYHAEKLPD